MPEQKALLLNSEATGSVVYQINTKPVDPDTVTPIAGVDNDTIITIVTVPASSVPTKVTVVEKKKTWRQKLIPKKKEADNPVGVISDNPGTRAEFIEQTPWWEYVTWFVGVMGPIIILINIFADKFGWLIDPLKSIVSFLFKKKRK